MKIFKSKRGIALENAIIFMVMIFSLCTLLTSLALIGHHQVKIENKALLRDAEIRQIGEDYLASVGAQTDFTNTYENYAYEVSGNALTVWRQTDQTKTVVLYVEAESADTEIIVKSWRYSLPTPTE